MKKNILSILKQLGVAFLFVSVAVVIRVIFFTSFGRGFAYLTFYPTVALVALYGTFASGIIATVLSVLLTHFWIQQGNLSPVEIMGEIVFIVSCVLISFVGGAKNNARKRELEARKEIELKNSEIVQQNKVLLEEIKARKESDEKLKIASQELEKKFEDTEKMNKSLVGRELRMAELKKENEELKQELTKMK